MLQRPLCFSLFPASLGVLLLAAWISLSPPTINGADRPAGLQAGAFAIDITPTKWPISVNGNMQDHKAAGAHDRIHARCLVLDDGKTQLVLCVVDSCMVPRELLDDAKAQAARLTGIAPERMLISATHTHSAPTVAGVFQSEPDRDYQNSLAERIARGIEQAFKNRVPARIGWGVGQAPDQVFNRRWFMKPGTIQADPFGRSTDQVKMNPGYQNAGLDRPAGPTDPEVAVLSVQSARGQPIALLANYSLHYVGGLPAVSADYFGIFAERITQLLEVDRAEPAFVGILSNGTSGDINNVNFAGQAPGKRAPGEQARLVADRVARVAHEVYRKIQHRDTVTLAMVEKEIELGVRLPGKMDLERAEKVLAEARATPLKTLPEIYARETTLLAKYPATVKVKLQALRIGELGIAAIPCEVFVEIGLEIKKKSPLKPTFTIELANGYNGYLPTPKQHGLGGYETWRARSSYLEVEAAPKITATVLRLLDQVK
jgi:hypothetical protein